MFALCGKVHSAQPVIPFIILKRGEELWPERAPRPVGSRILPANDRSHTLHDEKGVDDDDDAAGVDVEDDDGGDNDVDVEGDSGGDDVDDDYDDDGEDDVGDDGLGDDGAVVDGDDDDDDDDDGREDGDVGDEDRVRHDDDGKGA